MSNASATTITVNTALFAAGDTVHITNLGAGVCTITAGTATVNTSASLALAQYESGFLDFTSTSAAIFVKGAGTAAAASGMTLIKRASFSNVANTGTTFDNVFTSSYFQYLIILESISAATSGDDLQMQSRYGAVTLANAYYGAGNSIGYNTTAANIQLNNANQWTLSVDTGAAGGEGSSANIWVSQAGNTSQNMNIRSVCFAGSTALQTVFSGAASVPNTYDGFLLKSSTSNITGAASIYGMAK
jgi:hypothetical protein